MRGNKKIGIITWHYYSNYGSMLQAYALQKTIADLGYDVFLVNYRDKFFGTTNVLKDAFRLLLSNTVGKLNNEVAIRFSYPTLNFQRTYFNQTRLATNKNEMRAICEKLDCIVCGSDQIWAPNVFNDVYMASFIDGKTIKKISYAASIGLNSIPDSLVAVYAMLLSDFSVVSVREEQGQRLLREKCAVESETVLDPTLLLNKEIYEKIETIPKMLNDDRFIFCYFLNDNHEYRQRVEAYAIKHKLEIIGISMNVADFEWMRILQAIGPGEFLWLIHNAEVVFTDSYHGTIFSMIYEKNFYTFERFSAENQINQNSRIYQLGNWFDISCRIISNEQSIDESTLIAFDVIRVKINDFRKKSIHFLSEALK